LQKLGPGHREIPYFLKELDHEVARLLEYFDSKNVRTVIASEYGVVPVDEAVAPNRALREAGLVSLRIERGREMLDAGASAAFVVADHQIAHVYINDPAAHQRTMACLEALDGVESIEPSLGHKRSGDVVLVAKRNRWFCHDWWLDDALAPDYQRTVDIHRKPGYDPRELFLDPSLTFPKLTVARKLLLKKLGFRTLLDVIPLDTALVKGSHGRVDQPLGWDPVLIADRSESLAEDASGRIPCTSVKALLLSMLFD
jgi:hypothetical protein